MRTILTLLTLALIIINAAGQTLPKNDPLKLDADYYLMDKDFKKALTNYLNVIKSEPENADIKYKIGICYMNSENEKNLAIPYLEEASQKVSEKYNPSSFKETNAPVDALFVLGSAYRINNQLDEAIGAYTRYREYLDPKDDYNLKVVDQYLKSCELAKTMEKQPVNMTSVNLGSPLNTVSSSYRAVVSGDGKTMFYTTTGRLGYDIYLSLFKDTAWTTPRNVTSVLGAGKYMMTSDLSFDGQTLLLTLEDPMNSDIYESHFIKGRWSKAEAMGKEINSKYNETHASLSNDGKVIYFTSDRKGGLGDKDIYKSVMNLKGEWDKAENLGPVINTPFNEETPFMSETGDKLFFSSEGHEGIGGYDIFYYDFSNPSKGVVNLGYPLNTTDNDLFYVPTGDGMTAYYAFAGKDSYGGKDIYLVSVEERQEEEVRAGEGIEERVEEVMSESLVEIAKPDSVADLSALAVEEPSKPDSVEEEERGGEERVGEVVSESVAEVVSESVAEVESESVTEAESENVTEVESESVAEVVSESVAETSFKIQILALRKPADLKNFLNLPGIRVTYNNDNWYRYTLGTTLSRQEAESLLSEVMSKGYKDAFIKASPVDPQFTIQVMAVPGPVVDLSQFTGLTEIFVIRGADNYCRYSTGEYSTREEALASLDTIRSKGYKKAFVTRVK
jgi:tetratricopeptide (TPR) repeat protein